MTPPHDVHPLELRPGTQLGNYIVVSPLGRGGMGAVYLVERDGQRFAAKLSVRRLSEMTPAERASTELRSRREISILFAVSHPNLVRIHAADLWPDVNGYPYLVTDFVDGVPVHEWQSQEPPPSLEALVRLFQDIARALHTLHNHHFVHRDLKSQNVLVEKSGRAILIDFGISRQRDSYTVTEVASIVGTPDHLSPEYARFILSFKAAKGARYVAGPGDDLHAVGLMLYECLTGRPAFEVVDAEDDISLLRLIGEHVPAAPSEINPRVPATLESIVMRLLEKEPAARFKSGEELADALERALADAPSDWQQPFERPAYVPLGDEATVERRGRVAEREVVYGTPLQQGAVHAGAEQPIVTPTPPALPRASTEGSAQGEAPGQRSLGTDTPSRLIISSADDERPAFVPVEAESVERAPVSADPSTRLPSVLREGIAAVQGQATGWLQRWALLGASVGVLIASGLLLYGRSHPPRRQALPITENETAPSPSMMASRTADGLEPQPSKPLVPIRVPASSSADPAVRGSLTSPAETREAADGDRSTPSAVTASLGTRRGARPRSLLRNAAMGLGNLGRGASDGPLGIVRGERLEAKLVVPVDPDVPGSVTAVLTKDVFVKQRLVVPKGAMLVGASRGGTGARVAVRWDTLNLPDGTSLTFEGVAHGTDGKAGLPLRAVGGGGASSSSEVDVAMGTAERLADRALGEGVVGDVGRAVLGAGGSSARRGLAADSSPEHLVPAPAGTHFYVFVERPF